MRDRAPRGCEFHARWEARVYRDHRQDAQVGGLQQEVAHEADQMIARSRVLRRQHGDESINEFFEDGIVHAHGTE